MSKERLSIYDRINLQAAIKKNFSLKECARLLKKNLSTIYREINNNLIIKEGRKSCSHCQKNCDKKSRYINGCCQDFIPVKCKEWNKFPYTCNNCEKTHFCWHFKRYYDCIDANDRSTTNRIAPRVYRSITDEILKEMDSILIKQIKINKQSLHHAYMSNDYLQEQCSERTIRRYIYNGYFTVKAHDLPRFTAFDHKYNYKKTKIPNIERMLGRTYADYLKYIEENPNSLIWQYDSVEGKKSDKQAILTITFPKTRFQFGILIKKGDSNAVYKKIRYLQNLFKGKYKQIFMVNLSDNGPEFSRFHELEFDESGERVCRMFFYKSL